MSTILMIHSHHKMRQLNQCFDCIILFLCFYHKNLFVVWRRLEIIWRLMGLVNSGLSNEYWPREDLMKWMARE